MVAPFLLNKEHPLYNVHGVFNGIFIHGNVLGDAMFYGSGAGKLPTASAVVADVVDCAKHLHRTVMSYWSSKKLHLTSIEEAKRRFFVRAKGAREELVSNIENIFGKVDIVQVPSLKGELGFITSLISEKEYKEKEEKLEGMISRIRIMD